MNKSNSLSDEISNKDKDNLIFDSMKEVLHFPSKQIRSNSLLNCFTTNKFLEALKTPRTSEYSKLLSQKKEQLKNLSKISIDNSFMSYKFKNQNQKNKSKSSISDRNTFNIDSVTTGYKYDIINSDISCDHNNKVGLNAPLSFREMKNNNYLFLEKNIHKNNSTNNYNIYDDIKKILNNKKNNYSFLHKIKNNEGIDSKRSFNCSKNNNNSNISLSSIKSKKYSKSKNNFNNLKTLVNNNKKTKNNYIIITKNKKNKNKTVEQNKNYNAFFESLLSNLKIKNKKTKNINYNNLYPIHNSKNKNSNNNIANISGEKSNKNKKVKPNESVTSSGTISMDFINSSTTINNNNRINNNYNLTKKFIANKNNHFKINLQKSSASPLPSVNNTSKTQSLQKSPTYSTTGRTKEQTKRSIYKAKQTNNNDNTKRCKTPLNTKKQRSIYTSTTNKSTNRKRNKSIDDNYYYNKCLKNKNFKGKINPFMDIYNRELLLKYKKEKKLEEMRRQELADEMLEVRKMPMINELSRKISKNNLPIYRRNNEMKNRKNNRTDKIKEIIITEKEITENTINDRRFAKNNFNKKNFDRWLMSNQSWIMKKNSKIEKIKNSIDEEISEVEDYTFKPNIDKNSEKIFYQNCLYSKYPVVERLLLPKESSSLNKSKYEEILPTFVPEINRNYHIRDNYYEFMGENQAEIFKELKEIINNKEKKF